MKTLVRILTLIALLSLWGCAGAPPAPKESASVEVAVAPIEETALLVPVGVDTAFVQSADSLFGLVLDDADLAELEAETEAVESSVLAADTLASVARFVQYARTGDDRFAMTAEDSMVVGKLAMRSAGAGDPVAVLVLSLDGILTEMDELAVEGAALGEDLKWNGEDPVRAAQSREVKVALLGFSERSTELREQLVTLQGGMGPEPLAADSAATQQEIGKLVREFGGELDRTINEMGRAAQGVTAGSLSPESLRALKEYLAQRRSALVAFEAEWTQFEATGSLDLANPSSPYNSNRMRGLLQRMEKDLDYLATLAGRRAAAIESAEGFQAELEARKEAEEYVDQALASIMELKKRNQALMGAYSRLAAGYWEDRLVGLAGQQAERERLYTQLDAMVEKAGGTSDIRGDGDLLRAYRAASDRLLALRRDHLNRVQGHDRLRTTVLTSLAADLYNRARVLGDPEDYRAAAEVYAELQKEQPGEQGWPYQRASLAWSRSNESGISAAESAAWRDSSALWLERCEEVLLARHEFEEGMAETKEVLGADQVTESEPEYSLQARYAALEPADARWFYAEPLAAAREQLAGKPVDDPEVRQWMLNIEILRKRLAFEAGQGEAFLDHYARQALLSETIEPEAATKILEYWSWDDAHLELRERWVATHTMPDSAVADAAARRDTLEAILTDARTPGARRQIEWSVASLDFLKLSEYDAGLERMHDLLAEVDIEPCANPEAGAIDSTIAAAYPVFLFNRGTFYQKEGRKREAFYCFLGVAEQYGDDLKTAAVARYSAASLLADGNKRGALGLVRTAINEALLVIQESPADFELETLLAMYELRQGLAGELGLFQEAVKARDEARNLRGLVVSMNVEVGR